MRTVSVAAAIGLATGLMVILGGALFYPLLRSAYTNEMIQAQWQSPHFIESVDVALPNDAMLESFMGHGDVAGVALYDARLRLIEAKGQAVRQAPSVLLDTAYAANRPFVETAWVLRRDDDFAYIAIVADARALYERADALLWQWVLGVLMMAVTAGAIASALVWSRLVRPMRKVEVFLQDDSSVQWQDLAEIRTPDMRRLLRALHGQLRRQKMIRAELEAQRQSLEHLMLHDELTELPNRAHCCHSLEQWLQDERGRGGLVVVFNIVDFKRFNDQFGQRNGDMMLSQMAKRLRQYALPEAMLGRLDADRLLMLVRQPHSSAMEHSINQIVMHLSEPYLCQGSRRVVRVCAGVVQFPDQANSADLAIANALHALGVAKDDSEMKVAHFDAEALRLVREREALRNDLSMALERKELVLFYQPKVDVLTGKLVGAEALVRWFHPVHGNVSPAVFIPIAEESDAIVSIGDWIMETAAMQLEVWRKIGLSRLHVAVNLSAVQFQSGDIVGKIHHLFQRFPMAAEAMELEITESAMLADMDRTCMALERLREAGMRVALDDFGTGYSSLSYLKKLPVNALKIDQAFVLNLVRDADDRAICAAVVRLAKHFGMQIVAEGVENAESMELLGKLGVDVVQGFHVGKPMAAAQFTQWWMQHLREHSRVSSLEPVRSRAS